ncbi:MAG: YihA family ribosome biogenesis GTP-binding protein [Lachnospiraceae bacterium]|jgi:GTP-binding protein|nr:YihA family ribosome biogenesis GTP-binding protein [Lachnospiraceae bacterium]
MNRQKAALKTVAGSIKQFPEEGLPEIAFIGKSNVGKSSLINSLLGRRSLARTSSAPGKTRTINWYEIDGTLYFVDLPGYGYAKVSKTEQQRWGKVIEHYLQHRASLKKVLLLIDIRHAPSADDQMMMEWLRYYQVPTVIVATKSDKIKKSQLEKQKKMLREALGLQNPADLLAYSSETKIGAEALWERILEGAEPDGSTAF